MTAIQRPGSSGRRAFLIFGAVTGLGLAGCSLVQPGSGGSATSPAPAPRPGPLPGTVAAAARENDLAAFAAAALDRFATRLRTADRDLLSRLRDAHLAHATVLKQQDPTSDGTLAGPHPTPTPAPDTASATPPVLGHSPQDARLRLHRLESRASRSYAAVAATPTGPADQLGRLALLWGSLAAASAGYATACGSSADPGPAVIGDHRMNVALPDRPTAMQNLVAQCYPMIFGYQTALAALSGPQADRARSGLSRYRELRDQLADQLTSEKLPVPVPAAAYRLPVQPTSAARATQLINRMETRILPYLGQWLATATPHDRPRAVQAMITTAKDRATWSAKIIVWPGYPTS